MAFTVEYLAIFRRTDSFCNNSASFTRLLQVDSEIRLTGGEIFFQNERTCGFRLSDGEVAAKNQRYFHLHFTWDGDPDGTPGPLERFISLLKKVRKTVAQAEGETETLWDDLSAHYAHKAYPLIHEVENLMRRLIANFMLVTVGREWVQETLPKSVEDAVKNSKRKDYLNVLHTVDFIHLGDFLFAPYSKKTPQDLYAKLMEVNTPEDAKALQEFVPESNWKRYFGGLVACDDLYLKSRWERLYDLRCTVAHNALMTVNQLEDIEKLIDELKPKLMEAIAKLSTVKVPPEDAELVAENAARNVNATVGEFITGWQRLESAVTRRLASRGIPSRRVPLAHDLVRLGILDANQMDAFEDMRRLRNSIVHGPATGVPMETLQGFMAKLRDLVLTVEANGPDG